MGKFTAIQTYSRFQSLWDENKIDRNSLTFILDTGQLYTHGIYLNSVAYGTEVNGAIDITIAGTSKSLSLSSHTHSNYLEKNKNIDIGTYKIVSGDKDLLYYNANNTYLGNSASPVYLVGTEGKIVKGSTTYTLLDTGNFSILGQTSSGIILSNTALFKYGNNTFSIDYVKRYNSTSNFDNLNSVTSAGTTTVNEKKYGFMTLYEDGVTSASWSQIRVDVTDRKLEFRTSSNPNTWISTITSIPTNTATVAGIVSAPGANNSGKVWKTDTNGTPAWRDEVSNTWRNIRINDEVTDSLTTGTGTGALYIKQGSGITVAWQENKIVISNASPNIWEAANINQEGYVPKSIANKILRSDDDGDLYWGDDTNTQYYLTLNGTVTGHSGQTDLGTIWAPTALADTGNYILATNSTKTGLTWVAKPTSNVTTTAVISSSSKGKTNITADQNNPYYNLIEGSKVARSIQFKGGSGISISSNSGVITFDSIDNTITSTLSNVDLISQWSNVEDLTTKLGNNDGSYIIQITYGSRIYTGYFSYVSDSSGVEEEILLHCSGKVESSPLERGRLYAKIGLNGSKVYLQLATTQNENNATVTIKYKKVL